MTDWTKEIESMQGWSFGDNAEMADQLAAETASGKNSATCSLKRRHPPEVGERSYIKDSKGKPVCVVEIAKVETLRFCDVNLEFALAEGYPTLKEWRSEHAEFFGRMDREFTSRSEVVCQWFTVLHVF